jgi:hypothetical protein
MGSPFPNVGGGLWVRGIPLGWINSRNTALGEVPRMLARPPLCDQAATTLGSVLRSERDLVFDNYHQQPIATYLANCLVPQDSEIRVTEQRRNCEQSHYQLTYVRDDVQSGLVGSEWYSDSRGWLGPVEVLLFARGAVLCRQQRAWTSRSCAIREETYGKT